MVPSGVFSSRDQFGSGDVFSLIGFVNPNRMMKQPTVTLLARRWASKKANSPSLLRRYSRNAGYALSASV